MSTYQTTSLSEPTGDERIPNGTFGYMRARNRHRLYSLIIEEFEKSGLTQADLARRSGKAPETICRWLATIGNMRIDSLSDLLFAISGAEPTYGVNYPLKQPARNDTRPEWLPELPNYKKSADEPKSKAEKNASSAVEANERTALPRPINRDRATGLGNSSTSAANPQERTVRPRKGLLEPSL